MEATTTKSVSLRDLLTVLSRRRLVFFSAFAVVFLAVMAYSFMRTPMYRAQADLIFSRQADLSSAIGGMSSVAGGDVSRELATSVDLIDTPAMEARVREAGGLSPTDSLPAEVSAEASKETNTLAIVGVSSDAETAARLANLYASEFVEWRKETAISLYQNAQAIIEGKLKQYRTESERQNPAYWSLNSRLADLKVLESATTGNYTIASPAVVPQDPYVPRHLRDMLFGILLAVVVAIVATFVAEQLDVRVRELEAVADGIGLPVLGRLPSISRTRSRQPTVTALERPSGTTAEAYRVLRGNLDFANIDGEVKSILVTSPSASEGKTTTVANLGVTLARAGKRVTIVEMDLRRPKLHRFFGLPSGKGIVDVLAGRCPLEDVKHVVDVTARQDDNGDPDETGAVTPDGLAMGSLEVITSGAVPPNPGELLLSRRLADVLRDLVAQSDVVLVDSPPFGLVGDASSLAQVVDGVMVVIRLGYVTRSMIKETAEFAHTVTCRRLGVVVTNAFKEGSRYYRRAYRAFEEDDEQAESAGPKPARAEAG